ncbi:hypothetical protein COT66_00375 [Candidatus Shapirobacteria bacterium CG09_land_8_20_14_0_10_49_15]|uniref:Polysaccharide biosynthesis protein C-terminal domain-containing protein n=2 Tax=Candidatus Shapironibacteriota TaxID=1752721 RepID=A0A2M8L743_9BACT|nr:MAG: hypothetical protein COT66_00375 [Candidatus Shapirobacteria bacterium CG09_land_8_20_14_0_10_49_15]PJE70008.1 MAG: hypothetical protein COU97_01960 [Candidatus Shapirobacteria bacterium CG10_big_fil_rev_8_21_14_0_10_48_15]
MRKKLVRLAGNKLIAGSLVMFSGTMVANVGNYIYHLLMGRMLGPVGYGELQSVISVAYLLFIFISALALTTTKFIAGLKGRGDQAGIRWLFAVLNRKVLLAASVVLILTILGSPLAKNFLHLHSTLPIIFAGLLFLISALSSVNRAILQGLLRFKQIVQSHISETAFKVAAAVILVSLGWAVDGATLALVLASLVGLWTAFRFLKPLRHGRSSQPDLNKKIFLQYGLPVFFFNLSFTSLFTNDIILVKHFFPAYEAGLYASLAVLGKIIFFATGAIPNVMFPMIVHRRSQGKKIKHLLLASLALLSIIAAAAVLVYWLFPKLMVRLLFGSDYLAIAPLLVWMAIFMSLYSLSYLLTSFSLSIEKTKVVFFGVAAALLQVTLIALFHQQLLQVVWISIGITGCLFLSLVVYSFYGQK